MRIIIYDSTSPTDRNLSCMFMISNGVAIGNGDSCRYNYRWPNSLKKDFWTASDRTLGRLRTSKVVELRRVKL